MSNINNFARRFRAGLASASPFVAARNDPSGGPQGSAVPTGKLEHCPNCRDEVDTDTQAHHQGVTYSWRRRCLRCGHVLGRGVYHNVPLLSDVPIPAGTMEWTTTPGKDRTGG